MVLEVHEEGCLLALGFRWGMVVPPSVDAECRFSEEGYQCFSGVSSSFEMVDKRSRDFYEIVDAAVLFIEAAQVSQYRASKDSWWVC